ncbi:hypothetical protein ILYODFUR_009882, partial [Ilyodon furcidens]
TDLHLGLGLGLAIPAVVIIIAVLCYRFRQNLRNRGPVNNCQDVNDRNRDPAGIPLHKPITQIFSPQITP